MSPAALRVGWCPGALRPMDSGDGLIVRVKPRGGRLGLDQVRAIARAALRYGNGALDLTSRANLQIRGVTEAGLPGLTDVLQDFGLLDPSAEAEAVRNVIASPLAGLDATAAFDVRPAVAALEARLVDETALHALPAKFGIVVDDGGMFGLGDVAGDIRFDARRDGEDRYFEIGLGGQDGHAARCTADGLPDAAAALVLRLIEARRSNPDLRHMADLVQAMGEAAIVDDLMLDHPLPPPGPRGTAGQASGLGLRPPVVMTGLDPVTHADRLRRPLQWVRQRADAGTRDKRGHHASGGGHGSRSQSVVLPSRPLSEAECRLDNLSRLSHPVGLFDLSGPPRSSCALGVAAPFGRLGATQLLALVETAATEGASELRLTPWRAVLIPNLDRSAAQSLATACVTADLITDPADPRLAVAACPGSPGCRRGTTPVLDHAAALAAMLASSTGREILLHVSGCGKGCAHRGEAALTLVGHDGAYDLVTGGTAGSEPLARGLTIEEAASRVGAWARGELRP